MVLAGLATTAVTLGLMGFSESLWVLLGLSAVSGFGAGMVNPGQQATVADVIGNERSGGTVLSTFQMAQDGGAILGPVLIGVVADRAGFEAAFVVTGLVSLVALLPWLVARETLQKETQEPVGDGPAVEERVGAPPARRPDRRRGRGGGRSGTWHGWTGRGWTQGAPSWRDARSRSPGERARRS